MHRQISEVLQNIEKVIIGKTEIAKLSLVALLAEGHVLLEDVPGVGKTMLVKSIAKSIDADMKRIQFTPDLLPSDVLGVSVYNPKNALFEFHPGPIMGNIILADEINRTSAKTQSALLEAMEEKSVTVDGTTRMLAQPFFVMATQNPVEYEGTYPLPEAQLDRFLMKLYMGYPTATEEMSILQSVEENISLESITSVISLEMLRIYQQEVKSVYVDELVKTYIVNIAQRTRTHTSLHLGVSPRASISLMRACQAYAFIEGREYVVPDDVQYLTPHVFSHRIIMTSENRYRGKREIDVMKEILKEVEVPTKKAEAYHVQK